MVSWTHSFVCDKSLINCRMVVHKSINRKKYIYIVVRCASLRLWKHHFPTKWSGEWHVWHLQCIFLSFFSIYICTFNMVCFILILIEIADRHWIFSMHPVKKLSCHSLLDYYAGINQSNNVSLTLRSAIVWYYSKESYQDLIWRMLCFKVDL